MKQFKEWVINKFKIQPEKIEKLFWVKRKINNKNKFEWDFVDTIDFDISSLKTKKHVILDIKTTPKEVEKWKKILIKN